LNQPRDSCSSLERHFLLPARGLLSVVLMPLVRALAALHVTLNVVSFAQVLLAVGVVLLIPGQPRLAFVLFFAYLWFGVNLNDWAVPLAITLMGLVVIQGLYQLRGAMDAR
jgi:hypothetical protein